MSYVKNSWQSGDVITATKLNRMEDGIEAANEGGSGSAFHEVNATLTIDMGGGSGGDIKSSNAKGAAAISGDSNSGTTTLVVDKTPAEIFNLIESGVDTFLCHLTTTYTGGVIATNKVSMFSEIMDTGLGDPQFCFACNTTISNSNFVLRIDYDGESDSYIWTFSVNGNQVYPEIEDSSNDQPIVT